MTFCLPMEETNKSFKEYKAKHSHDGLNPCPWCGAEMSLVVCDEEGNLRDKEYAQNPWSGLGYKIKHPFCADSKDCPIEPSSQYEDGIIGDYIYWDKESAIKSWNTRKG